MGATMSSDYYTNPNSEGYSQAVFGALCEKCERQFNFSMEMWDNNQQIICPFCGHIQDLRMAYNRYEYLQQQQQEQNERAAYQNFIQSYQQHLQESFQKRQQIDDQMTSKILDYYGQKRTSTNYTPAERTDCYFDPRGNFICNTQDSEGSSRTRCYKDPMGKIHCETRRY